MGWGAVMTIIHRPELEALIMEGMKMGRFHNVEDALMQALVTSPLTGRLQQGPAGTRVSRIELQCHHGTPGAPLALLRIRSLSSVDS